MPRGRSRKIVGNPAQSMLTDRRCRSITVTLQNGDKITVQIERFDFPNVLAPVGSNVVFEFEYLEKKLT